MSNIASLEVISIAEFVAMLEGVKGTTFISFTAETSPKLPKSCPFKGVRKIQSVSAELGYIYSNKVEAQAEREGVTAGTVQAHRWGHTNENRTMIIHNETGEHYLNVCVLKRLQATYRDENGTVIDEAALLPYLPKRSKSPAQANLTKTIKVCQFKFSGIIAVKGWGKEFVIRQLDAATETALQAAENMPEDVDAETAG